MTSRRVKAFRISAEAIVDILTGKSVPVPLPEGIQIVRYAHEWQTNGVVLILEHETFDLVPVGNALQVEDLRWRLL